jgi:hypothetical protein
MAEPLRKYSSADVPEYSSYPAEPVTVEVKEFGVVSEYEAMPSADASGYDEQGRQIGAALGRLVNKINEVIEPMRSKVSQQAERLGDDADLAKAAAGRTYEDVTSRIRGMASEAVCQARARATDLKRKSEQTVNDYPMKKASAKYCAT